MRKLKPALLRRLESVASRVSRRREIKTGWEVITGGNDFFEVTKAFHNALHGGEFTLTQQARDVFMLHTEQNRKRMSFDEDLVVIHDPQPAGLISSKAGKSSHWVWRCHIDLSHPNRDVWSFLHPMVEQYDAAVFSSPAFARSLAIPQKLGFVSREDNLSPGEVDAGRGRLQELNQARVVRHVSTIALGTRQ